MRQRREGRGVEKNRAGFLEELAAVLLFGCLCFIFMFGGALLVVVCYFGGVWIP